VNLRRWSTTLGLAAACLIFAIGATSSEAVMAGSGADMPRLLAAAAVVTRPTIVIAAIPHAPAPAFGSYAVIVLESTIAAALVCYAVLQIRRSTQASRSPWTIRLRGPPSARNLSLTAS
jgi:hypothetical protein